LPAWIKYNEESLLSDTTRPVADWNQQNVEEALLASERNFGLIIRRQVVLAHGVPIIFVTANRDQRSGSLHQRKAQVGQGISGGYRISSNGQALSPWLVGRPSLAELQQMTKRPQPVAVQTVAGALLQTAQAD
jgi:hypothetical protein